VLKAGIIDPKKVTRVALKTLSVAGMILTECLIDIKEEGAMLMGGGMPDELMH
jgi:chaperonin GroEL